MDNNHLMEYEVFKKVNSLREHHDDTYINYADEEQTTNGKKFTIRNKIKKNLTGFIEEVIDFFSNTDIFLHDVTSKWQAAIYSNMVLKLQSQTLILVVDYSMNVSHLTKKRLQAHWWAHQQSTLFPVVAYFLDVSIILFKQ